VSVKRIRDAAWTGAAVLAVTMSFAAIATKEKQQTFASPEDAGVALIDAAERFDVEALKKILGPDGIDLVVTPDKVQDENQSRAFAAQANVKNMIVLDPEDDNIAILTVGPDDWPTPIPIVKKRGVWRFDTKAGREEVLYRRIGRNELDAISVCHGYGEAQREYASVRRDGALVPQYAQHIVSTPGRQDGLAWQLEDGTWAGPIGEAIARVIAEGYTDKIEPYHGYHFKILKGQGPHAPLGEMDFRIKGVMIGGFAMVAAPADYKVTGVMTFLVSHEGVVYEKDLGSKTAETFREMTRYDPDSSWKPVDESDED
jgi:Protein of unknown function (DUF2950)